MSPSEKVLLLIVILKVHEEEQNRKDAHGFYHVIVII
jgi:hypothetical protein